MEPFFPLVVWVCDECWLMQIPDQIRPEDTFVEYGYFSSFSDHWLAHCQADADGQIRRWSLGPSSLVVEVGSNDGYFLRWFVEHGVPVLGIDPAANVAVAAEKHNVPTVTEFFGTPVAERLRREGRFADLLVGKNVLAQVPDLNDFVAGLKVLLAPAGVIAIEFPHLQRLIDGNQFDPI
jgi:2-polyprenyl-3-methyl-5-hydroxy-6-metoxy-1,4-benzoquinol methylase